MAFGDFTAHEVASGFYYSNGYRPSRSIVIDSTNRIYVVHPYGGSFPAGVALSYSDTGGVSWTEIRLVLTGLNPAIGLDEDGHTLHIVYQHYYQPAPYTAFIEQVKYITGDPVSGFSDAVAVGAAGTYGAGSSVPTIHVAKNNIVYITYGEAFDWKVRNIAGGIWSVAEEFGPSFNQVYSHSSIVSVNASGLYMPYIFWNDTKRLYYTYYSGGWVSPILLHNTASNIHGLSVAVDSEDTIHLAYHQIGNYIRYRYKPLGEDWSALQTVHSSSTSRWPSIGVDDGDCVCVAWSRGGRCYTRQTLDKGGTWSYVLNLAPSGKPSLIANTKTGEMHITASVSSTPVTQQYWDVDTLSPVSVGGSYGFIM